MTGIVPPERLDDLIIEFDADGESSTCPDDVCYGSFGQFQVVFNDSAGGTSASGQAALAGETDSECSDENIEIGYILTINDETIGTANKPEWIDFTEGIREFKIRPS